MINDLKNQKCQACSGNTPVFNENQISDHLAKLDNWTVNDEQKMIYKKFTFKTFKQALNFTNKVGELAAATQPMRGGRAPETAPISIAKGDFFFSGVYAPK